MTGTCSDCRFWIRDGYEPPYSGICLSKETSREAARELGVRRHSVAFVITSGDNDCTRFEARTPEEVIDGKAD